MTAETWAPACMEPDELADWQVFNRTAASQRVSSPCADCLPSFAAEMRAEGRCNGYPRGTEGHSMESARVETVSPFTAPDADEHRQRGREALAAVRLEARPDAVELVPELPCGTCLHASVCARKRVLDAIGDVPVRMPELETGLTLTLHAVVECDAYLRAPKAKATSVVAITRKPLTAEHRDASRRGQERARAAKAGQQG